MDEIDHYYIIQEENFPDYVGLQEDKDVILSNIERPQQPSTKEKFFDKKLVVAVLQEKISFNIIITYF